MNSARWLRRRPKAIHVVVALSFVPWLVLLGWLASVAWFITDDAFISFRYARNLLEGHGLVFNPGEYVEGYTNFLWVLELAAIWGLLGIRPEDAAQWLSVIYTAGTIVVMLWWVARMPALRYRWLVAWMALGLVCSSATFAVWTSGGGLETRQFTFFALAAVVCLSVFGANRWGLLAASLSLAAAALTRPEGLLLAACCVGWFVAHRWLTARTLDWRGTLALAGPFAILIGGHFLARYRYYGEWLPNTYYAKHVAPWYEAGFRYLWAAAIETGLYLLIPLAYVALRGRWRKHRDGLYALVLICVGAHMAYLLRIGGDFFEYRPLDFYWPLLAVPAANGVVLLGARIVAGLKHHFRHVTFVGTQTYAVILFVPVLVYSSAIQGALLFEGAELTKRGNVIGHIDLSEQDSKLLLFAPGMSPLVAISNDFRLLARQNATGLRSFDQNAYFTMQKWRHYENAKRGTIPSDALSATGAIGVRSFFMPDLTIVDKLGLVDKTIARNPVTRPWRAMAHEREPPVGYLQRRGVNFRPYPAAASKADALAMANYAVQVGSGVWMPFDAADHEWVNNRFVRRDLRAVNWFSQTHPAGNQLVVNGTRYIGELFLGRFETDLDGWRLEGKAVSNNNQLKYYKPGEPVFGHVGPGFLTTYWPGKWEKIGSVLSPKFMARDDHFLMFLIAGYAGGHVEVRLLVDGQNVVAWRGENTEEFEIVIHSLKDVAGRQLQLEVFNGEIGTDARLMLDHVMLMREDIEN